MFVLDFLPYNQMGNKMYSKKKEKRLIKQFERDNALGYPFHKTDNETANRAAFIKQLIANQKFVETYKQNDKKFEESWREILKKMNVLDYIMLISITLCAGGFGYLASTNTDFQSKTINQHKDVFVVLFTLIGLLAGVIIGLHNNVVTHRINKQSDVDNFYNRMIVRLFDIMRETYPDLDENMLKQCNPEMARVITAIMIANMPESDTRTIQDIAIRMMRTLRNMDNKNKIRTLSNCNVELKNALSIVEHNLLTNPTLNEAILSIYRGNVPATFILGNNQKTK